MDNFEKEFTAFEQEYARRRPQPVLREVPEPELEEVSFIGRSVQMWVFGPIALGAVVLSGTRTFHSLQQLSSFPEASVLEGLTGVLVIELAIVGFQVLRIWRKIERNENVKFDTKWLGFGVGLALLCAVITNLDSTLLSFQIEQWIAWRGLLLATFLGPAIPVLGIIGGEIVGGLLADHAAKVQSVKESNQAKVEVYQTECQTAEAEYLVALDKWRANVSSQFTRSQRQKSVEVKPEIQPRRTKPKRDNHGSQQVSLLDFPVTKKAVPNGDF